ncbi:SAV-6107-like HEPN domain-containing protein [Frankia sp. AgKG'84/4]
MAVVDRPVNGRGSGGGAARVESTSAAPGASAGPPQRALLPAAGLPHRSRDELLAAARRGLGEAEYAPRAGQRYALAHLAALRAAAAVLADRARPRPGRRGRPVSAWCLLVRVAPEFAEWADFFAAGAGRRAAAEAGLNVVGRREADDLVRQVGLFLGVVEDALGLPSQRVLVITPDGLAGIAGPGRG